MNSSTVSSFFSRDVFLKRQARTSRKQAAAPKPCPSSSLKSKPLHIIIEEDDESRTSFSTSSRSTSPMYSPSTSTGGSQTLGVKAKRRHANVTVSDIRVARAALVHNDNDISEQNSLLSAPRPAPRPPTSAASSSPVPSPDSFNLTFTDISLRFPHPPIPTPSSKSFENRRPGFESPTPSMSTSSASTSPDTRSTILPMTPSSSDDEFPSYYSSPLPTFNPRRASIKPLVITKINSSPASDDSDSSSPATRIRPFKGASERIAPLSPITSDEPSSDSEESDSEWYNREFSQILSMCSPIPVNFPRQTRPDSMAMTDLPPSPSPAPRTLSPSERYPSAQLDPAFPRRRRSRVSIPKYPPPPVPPIPAHLRSPSTSSIPPSPPSSIKSRQRCNALSVTPPPVRRPPPRSSIPADCVFVDESYAFSDDSGSAFSFSLYEDPAVTPSVDSPTSFYSQPSPAPSPFPSSFPSSPASLSSPDADVEFDFPVDEIEFDIDLDHSMMLPLSLPTSPIDLETDIAHGLEALRTENRAVERRQLTDAEMFTTGVDPSMAQDVQRTLRSKWSSSTLASIHEEQAHRGTSAKLRSYFTGAPILVKGRGSRKGSGSVPPTPLSPSKRFRHMRRESEVTVIGFGQGQGVKRRGSVTPSVSDDGSEESASSSSSAGLRRKPIPVEMFLRTGA
ncbi:hypothetical protein BDZ94DRAFT_1320456 [Collybia nuda]|uniref:Uncharacterized protein n=1 Tax=Collybia nuda TaxID=64659 RepID=A0A9P5YAG9_9AGAR|nr:hypothetical protein BDZ94DRAFT_1320456 [Collybia nuda]